jgi:hypothetical protein
MSVTESYSVFYGAVITIFGSPLVALVLVYLLKGQSNKVRLFTVLVSIVFVLAPVAGVATKISLVGTTADAIVLYSAYLFFCVIVFSAIWARSEVLRLVIMLPGVGVMAAGALLGSGGFLFLGFVVADSLPVYEATMRPGLACRVTSYGNTTTQAGGYVARAFEISRLVPVFEREVGSMRRDIRGVTVKSGV